MTLAVAMPNWVGDAVMATPTLRALRAKFSGEKIVAVLRPGLRPVVEPNPWVDDYIEVGRSAAGFRAGVAAIREERIDMAVLLPNSFRVALLFWLGRARRRVGYDRGGRGMLLTDRLRPERRGGRFVPTPQITYYLALAGLLGASIDDRHMELFTTAADEAAAEAAFRSAGIDPGRTLLLCPGYSFGPSKAWPAEHWAAVVRGARDRFGLDSAILCGPSEAAIAQQIVDAAGGCATLHDKGITLSSAKAVVRRAKAMVAIDSGLRHYAAAFNRPVVALFGPTHIAWTETWHPTEVRLQAVAPCGPCQQPVCPTGTTECMQKIRPDEVLDALAEAMGRESGGRGTH